MRLIFKKDGIDDPTKATKVWWKEGDRDPITSDGKCDFQEFCH